ncbi:MAG: hypothetical protein JNJ83_03115 [Verrucomicrobiaceae bacterium]|nr:hypothetical protein [Verrucomicrobiaceae bacterium]
MLAVYDFAVTQLRYVMAAMVEVPAFRPDGASVADVEAMLDGAEPIGTAYVSARMNLGFAQTGRRLAFEVLNDACVDFFSQAGNAFRKDAAVMEQLGALPVNARAFPKMLARADAILAAWAQLPLIGVPPGVFVVAQVDAPLTRVGMLGLRDAAVAAGGVLTVAEQAFQLHRSALNAKLREMRDFVVAALRLGRSQFPEGSVDRGLIDAVPKRRKARREDEEGGGEEG